MTFNFFLSDILIPNYNIEHEGQIYTIQSQPTFLNKLVIVHIRIIREPLGLSQLAGFAHSEDEETEEEEHDQLWSLWVTLTHDSLSHNPLRGTSSANFSAMVRGGLIFYLYYTITVSQNCHIRYNYKINNSNCLEHFN